VVFGNGRREGKEGEERKVGSPQREKERKHGKRLTLERESLFSLLAAIGCEIGDKSVFSFHSRSLRLRSDALLFG